MESPERPADGWRWEWASSATAVGVPEWMRIGPGREGALHAALFYLTVRRRSHRHHPEWAYRPAGEVRAHELARRGMTEGETLEVLRELERFGLVERREDEAAGGVRWRALPVAVEAIHDAYEGRHPMLPADKHISS